MKKFYKEMNVLGDCNSCPSKGTCGKDSSDCGVKNNPNNKIKKVIGIMSGKGGVGKSTVSVMVAKILRKKGYSVGIMDADIMGPSVGRLMGLGGERAYGNKDGITPVETDDGIKVMSLNFMIDDENQPVVWRGALLSSCVTQFWSDVLWGELDYLIIDMPPGTGDITLTLMQSIPLSGVLIVSIPQDMVFMIVSKSINMAKKLNVKIYGIIENMSYMICPCCNEKIKFHSDKNLEKFIKTNSTELLAELPMNANLAEIAEEGYENISDDIYKMFDNVIKAVEQ